MVLRGRFGGQLRLIGGYASDDAMNMCEAGNDLRKVAGEVARIEREFEGTLNLTMLRDTAFEVVSDALKARFHSCRAGDSSRHR